MFRLGRVRKIVALSALLFTILSLLPTSAQLAPPAFAQGEVIEDEEIVYIDDDGRIKVFDTNQIGNRPLVEWESPEDDFRSAALGDFNNDGDMEIVAIKGGETDGKLVIYDPVVAEGGENLPEFNGIPWEKLYEQGIPGKPTLVAAGDMDAGIPGDEIFYGHDLVEGQASEGDVYRTTVIKPTSLTPDGRSWTFHIPGKDFGDEWDQVYVGNLDYVGNAEVALVEEDGGKLSVYHIEDGFQRFFKDSSDNVPYRSVVFADFYGGGNLEVVASRRSSGVPSLLYFSYNGTELTFTDGEFLQPYPRVVWAADVNGSGDDEILMLRRDQAPRLIGRNNGADGIIQIEDDLDSDDGYRAGAGGDIDGDGRDEVVIIRDDTIRIYPDIDVSMNSDEHSLDTNRATVLIGDLDKAGFVLGPQFGSSVSSMESTLEAGVPGSTRSFDLTNDGGPDPIPFSFEVSNNPSWVEVNAENTQTPSKIFVRFDATSLLPGTYQSAITFTTSDPEVINSPYTVPLILTVKPALVVPVPGEAAFVTSPCEDATLDIHELRMELQGSEGIQYSAAILDVPAIEDAQAGLVGPASFGYVDDTGNLVLEDEEGNRATVDAAVITEVSASAEPIEWSTAVDWASATSDSGVIPDVVTISVDPNQRDRDIEEAVLIVVADARAGEPLDNLRYIPIYLMCADYQLFTPHILR